MKDPAMGTRTAVTATATAAMIRFTMTPSASRPNGDELPADRGCHGVSQLTSATQGEFR